MQGHVEVELSNTAGSLGLIQNDDLIDDSEAESIRVSEDSTDADNDSEENELEIDDFVHQTFCPDWSSLFCLALKSTIQECIDEYDASKGDAQDDVRNVEAQEHSHSPEAAGHAPLNKRSL